MNAPPGALALIKGQERLRLQSYRCPAGVWTVGYGHTRGVLEGQHITPADAERLFLEDVADAETVVAVALREEGRGLALGPNAFGALVSFVFNVGPAAFKGSTLLRKLCARDIPGAADEFLRWVYARVDGLPVRLPGLVTRRELERALFLAPDAAS